MVRLLAHIAPDAEVHLFDQTFSLRPKYSVLYGNAMAWWAMIEARLSDLFIGALGVRAKPALAALATLSSTDARQSSIFAAIRATLRNQREIEVLKEVQKDVLAARKERNFLAHWIWCVSTALPDDLIAVNPDSWLTNGGTDSVIELHKPCQSKDLGGDARLYGFDEFSDILTLMQQATLSISMMRYLVMVKDAPSRRQILDELEALPHVAKSLKQARDSRRKAVLVKRSKGKVPQRREPPQQPVD